MKKESGLKTKNTDSSALIKLDLLPYAKLCKTENNKIWDPTRRKWLEKEPEELVRQGLIYYLHEELNFPYSRMRAEYQIMYNNLRKRLDLVLFGKHGRPILLAEVKSWKVQIDQSVLKQLGTYNLVCNAPYIMACNGNTAMLAEVDREQQEVTILDSWPKQIKSNRENE